MHTFSKLILVCVKEKAWSLAPEMELLISPLSAAAVCQWVSLVLHTPLPCPSLAHTHTLPLPTFLYIIMSH